MERRQPAEFVAELKAMAGAAGVAFEDLLLLQCFGDVARCIQGAGSAPFCTSFALLPPLTRDGVCLVGRNLDYYDHGVGDYASVLACYRPAGRIPFVTVTWAGVANGWTLINEKGIVVSNNTSFGERANSLEGVSTCYLLRLVAERASTVEEALRIVREAPRACATSMLIASGRPPDAAIVEFDHEGLAVRRPRDGFVGAANEFQALYQPDGGPSPSVSPRIAMAEALARALRGRATFDDHIAGAPGVPIRTMNLHCATIDATNLRIKVAMGRIPACDLPLRGFRLTADGLAADAGEPGPAPAAAGEGSARP